MIDRKILNQFLNKEIGVLYKDSNREIFARGVLKEVTDNTILLQTIDSLLALDHSSVIKIKGSL
jgi:hypothetical protein